MYIFDSKNNRWMSLRETAQYRQKKKYVRDAWIVVAIMMLGLPLAGALCLALLATFLSFSALDESVYHFD